MGELAANGGFEDAPFDAKPELVCKLSVVWESVWVNMPFPRTPMVVGEEAVFTGPEKITELPQKYPHIFMVKILRGIVLSIF